MHDFRQSGPINIGMGKVAFQNMPFAFSKDISSHNVPVVKNIIFKFDAKHYIDIIFD